MLTDLCKPQPESQPPLPNITTRNAQSNSEDTELTPEKVHLRGLDNLTSDHIKAFAAEYYSAGTIEKIEWIDDTSANLIYPAAEVARNALAAFIADEIGDISQFPILQMIPAKRFEAHPNSHLEVRLAVKTDRKQAGARDRSRFYLLNPEHDPTERRRKQGANTRGGPKYRDRDDDGYRSQIYDTREQKRRQEGDAFDANLYDDDEAALAIRAARHVDRRDSRSSNSSIEYHGHGVRKRQENKELFPERVRGRDNGRLRDRSASPLRDREGDQTMSDSSRARINIRARNDRGSSANRLKAQLLKANLQRESISTKELFPEKRTTSNRRATAFDPADEAADLFANRMPVPFYDGSSDVRPKPDLISRVAKPSLEDRISSPLFSNGLSIKGSAKPNLTTGISIKGTAPPSAIELFPGRMSTNAGKELFRDKLEGRGGRRQKAEDLFH